MQLKRERFFLLTAFMGGGVSVRSTGDGLSKKMDRSKKVGRLVYTIALLCKSGSEGRLEGRGIAG